MDPDLPAQLAQAIIEGLLTGIGALFVGFWEASLQHPWIPVVIVAGVALSIVTPTVRRRRRRYGYR